MDIAKYNQQAWDRQVAEENQWTRPVSSATIEAAREGEFEIVLTPIRAVPRDWFPPLSGCDVLGLACGGGQQAPILAAAGANVTVVDNSPAQLAQDQKVADRDGLKLTTRVADMRDLSCFDDKSFDLVFHPCSLSFVPEVQPVFDEVHRVLRPGGIYVVGFCNPLIFIFNYTKLKSGVLDVQHSIPYSDLTSLSADELAEFQEAGEPLCFGHSLEQLIGGQLRAGLQISGFFEDVFSSGPEEIFNQYLPTMIATRAIKPLDENVD